MTIYLVKKNPRAKVPEWIWMDGKTFYAFIHSEEGKRRHFIRLADDIDFECDEIYIEGSYDEFRDWRKEFDAHRYLKETQKEFTNLSLNLPLESGNGEWIDILEERSDGPEDIAIIRDEYRRLRQAIRQLPVRDQELLYLMFFSDAPMTERQVAETWNVCRSTVHYLKQEAFKKILEKLLCKP